MLFQSSRSLTIYLVVLVPLFLANACSSRGHALTKSEAVIASHDLANLHPPSNYARIAKCVPAPSACYESATALVSSQAQALSLLSSFDPAFTKVKIACRSDHPGAPVFCDGTAILDTFTVSVSVAVGSTLRGTKVVVGAFGVK